MMLVSSLGETYNVLKIAKTIMSGTWTIVYEWGEDGWWVSEVVEVPGAISQGKTKEEAKVNVLDALNELLEFRREEARAQVAQPENIEIVKLAS